MRLEINYRGKKVKNTNTWRLNNIFQNNQEITEEIKEKIKKHLETTDNENPKKREFYRNTILPQETRKISKKQSNLTCKGTRERRTNKTRS